MYLGLITMWATPNASSIVAAVGSITNSFGDTDSNLTHVYGISCVSVIVVIVPGIGTSVATISILSCTNTLPIPVPNMAPLSKHSAIASLTPSFVKSSWSKLRIYSASCLFSSRTSSSRSNQRLPPKIASSNSATVASIACDVAGEISLLFSDCLVLSSFAQIPRHNL